jgi:hypothetical protein
VVSVAFVDTETLGVSALLDLFLGSVLTGFQNAQRRQRRLRLRSCLLWLSQNNKQAMAVATTNKRRRIGTRINARVKKVFFTLPFMAFRSSASNQGDQVEDRER